MAGRKYIGSTSSPLILLQLQLLPNIEGGLVVNISSMAHDLGGVATDYFANRTVSDGDDVEDGEVQKLRSLEANRRYGASKLLLLMAGCALQRQINAVGSEAKTLTNDANGQQKRGGKTCIVSLDPGGMSGDSKLGAQSHPVFRVVNPIMKAIGPIATLVKKDAYNSPEVPAKSIAGLFELLVGSTEDLPEGFYIMDNKTKSSVLSLNEKKHEEVFKINLGDLKETLECCEEIHSIESSNLVINLYATSNANVSDGYRKQNPRVDQ